MADPDVARACRAIALAARAMERAAADRDLTLAQYRVLALIAAGDERSTLLASSRLAVAKPTITAVVDGLVERGFIERGAVDGDRRSIRLGVTKTGSQALRGAEREMAAALERILGFGDERDSVLQALGDLDDALAARSVQLASGAKP